MQPVTIEMSLSKLDVEKDDGCILTVVRYDHDKTPATIMGRVRRFFRKGFRRNGPSKGGIEILLSDQLTTPKSLMCVRRDENRVDNVVHLQVLAANLVLSMYHNTAHRELIEPAIAATPGDKIYPYGHRGTVSVHLKVPSTYLAQVDDQAGRLCQQTRFTEFLEKQQARSPDVPPIAPAADPKEPIQKNIHNTPAGQSQDTGHVPINRPDALPYNLAVAVHQDISATNDHDSLPYLKTDQISFKSSECSAFNSVVDSVCYLGSISEDTQSKSQSDHIYLLTREIYVIPPTFIQQRRLVRFDMTSSAGMFHLHTLSMSVSVEPNTTTTPHANELILGISENPNDFPVLSSTEQLISPVLVCMPHEVSFNHPVSVSLPLLCIPDPDSRIKILRNSADVTEPTDWHEVHDVEWFLHPETVSIYMKHFCMYCVVAEKMLEEHEIKHRMVSVFLRAKALESETSVEVTVQFSKDANDIKRPVMGGKLVNMEVFPVINKRPITVQLLSRAMLWNVRHDKKEEVLLHPRIATIEHSPLRVFFHLCRTTQKLQSLDIDIEISIKQCQGIAVTWNILESLTELFSVSGDAERQEANTARTSSSQLQSHRQEQNKQSQDVEQQEPPRERPERQSQEGEIAQSSSSQLQSHRQEQNKQSQDVEQQEPPRERPERQSQEGEIAEISSSQLQSHNQEQNKENQDVGQQEPFPCLPETVPSPDVQEPPEAAPYVSAHPYQQTKHDLKMTMASEPEFPEKTTEVYSVPSPESDNSELLSTSAMDSRPACINPVNQVHETTTLQRSHDSQRQVDNEQNEPFLYPSPNPFFPLPVGRPQESISQQCISYVNNNVHYHMNPAVTSFPSIGPGRDWIVSYEKCQIIAEHLDLREKWKMLASRLRFDRVIDQVEQWAKNQQTSPTILMLREWMMAQRGEDVTTCYERLLDALKSLQRMDIVDQLEKVDNEDLGDYEC